MHAFLSPRGLVATNKETCYHPNSKVNLDCSLGNYSPLSLVKLCPNCYFGICVLTYIMYWQRGQ